MSDFLPPKRCPKCYAFMIEKPLFTSFYLECPRCDGSPKQNNNRDDEFPNYADPNTLDWDTIETPDPQPCYQNQKTGKTVHNYNQGNPTCTCGSKAFAIPPPWNSPDNNI